MADEPAYPKRPRFFAYRFCRVLAKACVANDLGAGVCWLLTVVAHTEDAKGYRGAVNFFNEQLMPLVGCKNVKALARLRDRAVRAGWLRYAPGSKIRAGRYWVEIPERHRDWDDLPTDEPDGCEGYSGTKSTTNVGNNPGSMWATIRDQCGQQSGQPSSLALALALAQDPLPPNPGEGTEEKTPGVGPSPAEVRAVWNAQPGLIPAAASDPYRDRVIRQWATGNELWVRHWRGVIEFVGRQPHLTGSAGNFRADLAWLFKASNFTAQVERMLAPASPGPGGGDEAARAAFRAAVAAAEKPGEAA